MQGESICKARGCAPKFFFFLFRFCRADGADAFGKLRICGQGWTSGSFFEAQTLRGLLAEALRYATGTRGIMPVRRE